MSGFAVSRSHIALGAIDALNGASTVAVLQGALASAIATFGLQHHCYAAPSVLGGSRFADTVLLDGWPTAWFEQYHVLDLHAADPVARHTRRCLGSFYWTSAPLPPEDTAGRRVMDAAAEHGLRAGICVPIQGLTGYQGSISLSGRDIEQSADAQSIIEVIAVYAVNRLNQLRKAARPSPVLTRREREVMNWVAAGKTAWDIGCILQISEDTVNKLVASAMRRLDVCTRPQAVAEAIRRGELSL